VCQLTADQGGELKKLFGGGANDQFELVTRRGLNGPVLLMNPADAAWGQSKVQTDTIEEFVRELEMRRYAYRRDRSYQPPDTGSQA
jgi:hypothetical protein